MRKTTPILLSLTLALTLWAGRAWGSSIVLTLTSGTQVYYRISSDNPPRMILGQDGHLTMNGQDYAIDDIDHFAYSSTDYDGEAGTEDGIASINGQSVTMKGGARVYTLDGQMVSKDGDLSRLPSGTYIISDGTTSLKLLKR